MKWNLSALPLALLLASTGARAQAEIAVTPDNESQILNLGVINTPYSEYTPFITADERYLFFQSNRPEGVNNTGDFDLWYTENQVTEGVPKFKAPANVGLPVNSAFFDGHPTLRRLPSGDFEMYFTSFAEEGRPGPQLTNLYYTIFSAGKWSQPKPVVEINTDFHDRMPSISQDGRYLFFSSDRPGGFGRDDVWVSEYDFATKRWSNPRNAGETINTVASEVTPAIHSDNITLYFSSDRAAGVGGYDIYVTQVMQTVASASLSSGGESVWKRPVNLGKPYNSPYDDEYPTVIRSGNYMYFASNRENGRGSFDIYRGKVPEFAKPEVVVTLKGRVKEKFSDKGIEANVRVADLDGERNFSTNQPEGLYSADLVNKKQYKMTITAPGYRPMEYIADLRDMHTPITIQKDFEMERVIALPKDVLLRISFENENGKPLKPNATYRLPPVVPDDTILKYKGQVAQLKAPAMSRYSKPEDALTALETMRLAVRASLRGYDDLSEERAMADLLRGANGDIKGIIDVRFVMKSRQSSVQVIPIKGPGGLEAIVYFSTNVSNRLNNEKAAGLKNIVELWNKQPHKTVYVYGHADSRGTSVHNMKLSKARAEFVKRRLVQYGIPAEMIVTRAFGETRPASKDENTLEGRRKNRRAEIYFDAAKRQAEGEPTDSEAVKEPTKPAVKKVPKKKKGLPPEKVEPSAKPKAAARPLEKSAAARPESSVKPTATDKARTAPVPPPNTELRVR